MRLIDIISQTFKKEKKTSRRVIGKINVVKAPWCDKVNNSNIDKDKIISIVKSYIRQSSQYADIIKDGQTASIKHYTRGQIDAWNIMLEILEND